MHYISSPSLLQSHFKRLSNSYQEFYWMVAWAGAPFDITEILTQHSHKIKQVTVGLHFYQTHPNFIELYNSHPNLRFVKDTSSLFHPKVYLFYNSRTNWELIVGSANFTKSAFNTNTESCLLVQSDNQPGDFIDDVMASIRDAYNRAAKFTTEEFNHYKIAWTNQKRKIESLSSHGTTSRATQFFSIPIVRMKWPEYMARLNMHGQNIQERIRLLDIVQDHFNTHASFALMPDLYRKQIGGYVKKGQEVDFNIFGNMLNSTRFTHLVNQSPEQISNALDHIPLKGPINHLHFMAFSELFQSALDGGNKFKSATRLLAMKRPDVFFCLSAPNIARIADDFGLTGSSMLNLNRYWHELIVPIQESDWYQNPSPNNQFENSIVDYRVAMLDAFYYNPEAR